MKKVILLLISIFYSISSVYALDIVYPKKKVVNINSQATFFVGSANPNMQLKINDIDVKVYENGAFAQYVPLAEGKNVFNIKSFDDKNSEIMVFEIFRPEIKKWAYSEIKLVDYEAIKQVTVRKDNTPLRKTPVNSGLNRISHLPSGMDLLVNGEKGEFYRVYLDKNTEAWTLKSDVKDSYNKERPFAHIKNINLKESGDWYEVEMPVSVPFTLQESENTVKITLFNINNDASIKKIGKFLRKNSEIKSIKKTYSENKLIISFTLKERLWGYDCISDGHRTVLKVRKPPLIIKEEPLSDLKIVIDAGHGGSEFGAIGCCRHYEKDINLAISKKIKHELQKNGATVYMTRETDNFLSLADRVKFIRNKNAIISLSIHSNALPDGADPIKRKGTSVFYYNNESKMLADKILKSMLLNLKTQDDKLRQASLALVRPTCALSVLIEVGYMINPEDYALLLDEKFQQKTAEAIVEGLKNFILNK